MLFILRRVKTNQNVFKLRPYRFSMLSKNRNHQNHFIVGVIAATSTDVMLGIKLLKQAGIKTVGFPISKTPQEQTCLQINKSTLLEIVENAISHLIIQEKIACAFIYCNSLSALLDIARLEQKFNIPIITPMNFYKMIARQFDRFALIAANGQSVANIERILITYNPACVVVGLGNILMVNAIEKEMTPKAIIEAYGLVEQSLIFEAQGCQRLLLGCTHFTYFQSALLAAIKSANSQLEILEPSQSMLAAVLALKHSPEICVY